MNPTNPTRPTPPADLRRSYRIANELIEELNRREAQEAARCTGFDASDLLTDIRAARDYAIQVRETLETRIEP